MNKNMEEIDIIIDNRESKDIKELANFLILDEQFSHFNILIQQIPLGDIIVKQKTKIGNLAFELKRVVKNHDNSIKSNDFIDSIRDGRLKSQIIDLNNNFDNVILIIVGTYEDICRNSGFNSNAIAGMLGAMGSKYHCDIYQCESDESALTYAFYYIKHSNLELDYRPVVRTRMNIYQKQIASLSYCPSIGWDLSERILEKFSLGDIAYKSKNEPEEFLKELISLDGIGKGKALNIINFMTNLDYFEKD